MALDNAQLVEFCNAQARQIASLIVGMNIRIENAVAEYNARDLGTVITDGGSSNRVLDGSSADGRTIATGGDVWNLVTLMQDIQTFMTQGRKDVLAKWQVHGFSDL